MAAFSNDLIILLLLLITLVMQRPSFPLSAGLTLSDTPDLGDSVFTAPIMHSHSLWPPLPVDDGPEDHASATSGRRGLQDTPISSGEYMSRIGVYMVQLTVGGGSPDSRRKLFMIMDTASPLTWLQCQPCVSCHPQLEDVPIFDPAASSTLHNLAYDDPLCVAFPVRTSSLNGPPGSLCTYSIRYVDGLTTSSGRLVTDTFTLTSGHSFQSMPFGCSFNTENRREMGAAGLLSLDTNFYSFPSQLQRRGYSKRFSYCLPPRYSNANSTLTFGGPIPPNTDFTPLYRPLESAALKRKYSLKLMGISVGGTVLSIPHYLFDIDLETGRGGLIIDSGATVSTLPRLAYRALRDTITRAIPTRFRITHFSTPRFDTCYVLQSSSRPHLQDFYSNVPSVTYHFADGVDLHLRPDVVFVPREASSNRICLFIVADVSTRSYLGNVQQQHTLFTFDDDNSRVGIAPNAC